MTIHTMNITEIPQTSEEKIKRRRRVLAWLTAAVLVIGAAVIVGVLLGQAWTDRPALDPDHPLPPSASKLRHYKTAAVCTDGAPCSVIGSDILKKNGSVVDAAIAAAFCNGLYNMASMGAGGGFFMTVYNKTEEKVYIINARETASRHAHKDMFKKEEDSRIGGLTVGVPGEIKGLWTAHKRFGKLPWSDLISPAIDMCRSGFNLSKILHNLAKVESKTVLEDPQLRKMLYSESENKMYPEGHVVFPSPNLCSTLETISKEGGDVFYNGSLAQLIVADIQEKGGIIDQQDISNYTVEMPDPIRVELADGDVLYAPPPPSSGVLVGSILTVLSGYGFNKSSLTTTSASALTYHRIVEAFKYAYASRSKLGDIDFIPMLKELLTNITSPVYGETIRKSIDDDKTYDSPAHYGADFSSKLDSGTAHISILSPAGDAVSVTSSVNYYFGARFSGTRTGIIFNNVMDDFSSPNFNNYFGLPPSPANFIAPLKRPMSSMTPSIIIDRDKNVKMVVGASGGSKIITSVAFVIINKLWLDRSIKEAVDAPRIHHQLVPNEVEYEYGNLKGVLEGLEHYGHNVTRVGGTFSVVCALFQNKTGIYGNADYRKAGDVQGFN